MRLDSLLFMRTLGGTVVLGEVKRVRAVRLGVHVRTLYTFGIVLPLLDKECAHCFFWASELSS